MLLIVLLSTIGKVTSAVYIKLTLVYVGVAATAPTGVSIIIRKSYNAPCIQLSLNYLHYVSTTLPLSFKSNPQ